MTDLIARLGRIAYANPGWTPAATQHAPLKTPADLAPGPDEFRMVLAAVHHAADALTHLASAGPAAVRAAADAGTIGNDIFPASGPSLTTGSLSDLPRLYEMTTKSAISAAEAIDLPANSVHAPSMHLAVMRSALVTSPVPATAETADLGQARGRLLTAADEARQHQAAALCRASFPSKPAPDARASDARRAAAQPAHPRAVR